MTSLHKIPFKTRNGHTLQFSALGLGTAPLGNLYEPQSEATARQTIQSALDSDITYLDTAPFYGLGLAERRLGAVLRENKDKSLLVSTKAGRLLEAVPPEHSSAGDKWCDVPSRRVVYDYSYDGFMRSFEFSLERLGVDHIDILYCHDIDVSSHGSQEASDQRTKEFLAPNGGYKALESLRSQGAVKAIGLGVNEWQVSELIARETDSDLFLLAGRFTLLEQEALNSFLPVCVEKGMGVVIGGPYNSGILATGPVQNAYYNYGEASLDVLDRVTRIQNICDDHGVALRQAAIQFPLLHSAVVSVIPGSATVSQMQDTLTCFAQQVPTSLWSDLQHAGLIQDNMSLPS